MRVLVVYDSWFGNTEKVARAIGRGLKSGYTVELIRVDEMKGVNWESYYLFVMGTPVHGGRPSEKMLVFLKQIPKQGLLGKKVAVFDTRFDSQSQNWGLKSLMKVIGYAAPKLAKSLQDRGAELIGPPEGFIVEGKEGPLKSGELRRAEAWGKQLTQAVSV